eukprot:1452866-Prymnesium_polylepis.1
MCPAATDWVQYPPPVGGQPRPVVRSGGQRRQPGRRLDARLGGLWRRRRRGGRRRGGRRNGLHFQNCTG